MEKQCSICKSEFDLTKHHDKQPHLNRKQKTDNHTVILCATCHYEIDFSKILACCHKPMMKNYNKRMGKLEKSFII